MWLFGYFSFTVDTPLNCSMWLFGYFSITVDTPLNCSMWLFGYFSFTVDTPLNCCMWLFCYFSFTVDTPLNCSMWFFGYFSFTVDTPLREVFEEDSLFKDELLSRHATIRDLLAHRMGIPSNNAIRLDTNLTRENLIKYGK